MEHQIEARLCQSILVVGVTYVGHLMIEKDIFFCRLVEERSHTVISTPGLDKTEFC